MTQEILDIGHQDAAVREREMPPNAFDQEAIDRRAKMKATFTRAGKSRKIKAESRNMKTIDQAKLRAAKERETGLLKAGLSGDSPGNKVIGVLKWCARDCKRTTRNISKICDRCWDEDDR